MKKFGSLFFFFIGISVFSQTTPMMNLQHQQKFYADVPICAADSIYYGNQWYHLIAVGQNCWFKENLNIGVYDTVATNDTIIQKYCYNGPSNCAIYGGLYEWDEAHAYTNQINYNYDRGICPNGWHISSGSDWFRLANFIDPSITKSSFFANSGGGWLGSSHPNIASAIKANSALWGANRVPTNNVTQLSVLPGYFFASKWQQCFHLNWRDFNTPESEGIEMNGTSNTLEYGTFFDPISPCGIRCVKN